MKAIQTIACLVCAGVLILAYAQRPDGQSRHGAQQNRGQLDSRGPRGNNNAPVTDAEWQEAVTAMNDYCPNRINFIVTRLQGKPVDQEQAKKLLIELYRQMKRIPRNDLDLQN